METDKNLRKENLRAENKNLMEMLKIKNETPQKELKKQKQKKWKRRKKNIRKLENLSRKSHIQKEDFQNKRAEMAKVKKLTEIIQENSTA